MVYSKKKHYRDMLIKNFCVRYYFYRSYFKKVVWSDFLNSFKKLKIDFIRFNLNYAQTLSEKYGLLFLFQIYSILDKIVPLTKVLELFFKFLTAPLL